MRVLFLTEERISFSEALVRGGTIHVRNVVSGLRDRGHDVSLLDWNSSPERPFQVSIAPRTRFVEGPVWTALRAIRAGRRRGVDVVISKTRKTYLPGLVAARQLGVPHVIHVGSSLEPPLDSLPARADLMSFVARLRAPHDAYFVVCDHIGDQLRTRRIGEDRIYDVRNAVDTEQFHPEDVPVKLDGQFTDQIERLDSELLAGYVGGLHSYKGLDDFATALDCTEADCRVVIAGDGPERKRLERRFGDAATFLGPVPYEQVPALYHEFDAFVLPSHTEGLPRVILEAQATATPVIATRVGGVPEVITDGETGLLCPVQDPDALAAALDRLANETERRRLGHNGYDAVVDSYSWEQMYDRYERFLAQVVE